MNLNKTYMKKGAKPVSKSEAKRIAVLKGEKMPMMKKAMPKAMPKKGAAMKMKKGC